MIEAIELEKRFGAITAVADVSLDVKPGETLALLGPNGAGKTTTLRMLASLLRPTSGRAVVAGYDTVAHPDQVRASVGLLTELPGLYSRMTAMAYLEFFARLYGVPAARFQQRVKDLLTYFGLWEARNRAIGTFSKGMRQKTALVRAVLHEPRVVLLDEPTSAMDPASAKLVRDYLRGLKAAGATLLLCTHNLAEAEALADIIAVIKSGRIVACGSPEALKSRLLGAPSFEVRFANPVEPGLLHINGVLTVEATGSTWMRYRTEAPEKANPMVVRRLMAAGVDVVTVTEVARSLEAVYLGLVEQND